MINSNYFLVNVAALAIGTICIRGFFMALSSKMTISTSIKELFTFIPAAIFPALIVPITFFHNVSADWPAGHERFFVLIASGIFCYFIRNTFLVITFGLGLLYLVGHSFN